MPTLERMPNQMCNMCYKRVPAFQILSPKGIRVTVIKCPQCDVPRDKEGL